MCLLWFSYFVPHGFTNFPKLLYTWFHFHSYIIFHSIFFWLLIQFSSVTQSCPILCDPTNHSTPGLLVHHQLPEFTQTHVIESVMPSSHLILCRPLLLLPPIPPSIRVFSSVIFLGSKIIADGDCSHEIKRRLLLGRKVMTNLDSIFKSREIGRASCRERV